MSRCTLFTLDSSGVTDCKFPLDSHGVNVTMDYCETPSLFGCSRIIENYHAREEFNGPKNEADAKTFYITLIQDIEKL